MPAQLVVGDLDAAEQFYTGLLGLAKVKQNRNSGPTKRRQRALDCEFMQWSMPNTAKQLVDQPDTRLSSIILQHADGTRLRLVQVGGAVNTRAVRQQSFSRTLDSANQRADSVGNSRVASTDSVNHGLVAVRMAEEAARLAALSVLAGEAVLTAAVEAAQVSMGEIPAVHMTVAYAEVAQTASALASQAAVSAELAAANSTNAASTATAFSTQTGGLESSVAGGATMCLSFSVSEPEFDAIVERLKRSKEQYWVPKKRGDRGATLVNIEGEEEKEQKEKEHDEQGEAAATSLYLEDLDGNVVQIIALPVSRL